MFLKLHSVVEGNVQTLKQNKLRHALSCCNVLSDRGDPDQGKKQHMWVSRQGMLLLLYEG